MPVPQGEHPSPQRVTLGRMHNPVRGLLDAAAAVLAVVGGFFLFVEASSAATRTAVIVFALGLVALYTTSSLYHSVPWSEPWKRRMQRTDHSMIFVLIAASYTPVAVLTTSGWTRVVLLVMAWGITAVGVGQQVFFPIERNAFGITLMTTLGWIGLIMMPSVSRTAGGSAMILLLAGGVLYTTGMVMLVTQRPRLWPRVFSYHEAFHVLVVAASALHFISIYRSLAVAG
ncbi:MAG: hemolysin III family protein [Acidimicrobiia bacterium]|nr:hemolysin III family protein [Acidimicrobiia bacterium]